jgi:transcriptional regulator with XRE-family HTH domain
MDNKPVKNFLSKIRESKNLTQEQLAEISGVTRYIISDFENEKRRPSARTISRLSEALGCSYLELMTGKDDQHNIIKKKFSGDKQKYLEEAAALVKKSCNDKDFDIELLIKISGHLSDLLEEYDLSSNEERKDLVKSIRETRARMIASDIFLNNKLD